MSFPKKVSEKALVACKRHCCLCEKYVGIKMELHHIKEKAKGGKDTFENCLPVCLMCHSEVGSYNDEHPKGKKYSRNELIVRRDDFYGKIKEGYKDLDRFDPEDRNKLLKFKKTAIHLCEEIIKIDFTAVPFRSDLLDDIILFSEEYYRHGNCFEYDVIDKIKIDILEQLEELSFFISPSQNFVRISQNGDLIFNNSSETLEELREGTLGVRIKLSESLHKLYKFI